MNHFYGHVMSKSREINKILSQQQLLLPMLPDQIRQHKAATKCANCHLKFTHQNHKVAHYDHVTGQYLLPAATTVTFNLSLKIARPQVLMRTQTVTP